MKGVYRRRPWITRRRITVFTVTPSGLFQQEITGALSFSGTPTNQPSKIVSGILSFAGNLVKETWTALAGSLSSSGTLAGLTGKTLAGDLTSAGALVNQVTVTLAGALSSAGAMLRHIQITLTGSLSSAGDLTKQRFVELAGALSSAGAMVTQGQIVLSGALSSAGELLHQGQIVLSGILSSAGVLTKQGQIILAGALSWLADISGNLFARIFPSEDTAIGQWTDELDGTVDIFNSINESVADDNDYIKSEEDPVASIYRTKLQPGTDPSVHTDHSVSYRYKKSADTATMNMIVRLKNGVTVIATWTHNDVGADWVTAKQTLTEEQAGNITDYTDLYIEFQADKV